MTENIRQHPVYHQGFYDAQASEPLFDDADEIYRAGWQAYWQCRAMVSDEPATELRHIWTGMGVSQERQDQLIAEIIWKAQPGMMVGPFEIKGETS